MGTAKRPARSPNREAHEKPRAVAATAGRCPDAEMTTFANLMSRLVGRTKKFLAEIFDEDTPEYESMMEAERAQKQRTRISWSKNLNNLS